MSPTHGDSAVLGWADLEQRVPASVIDVARKEWDGSLRRGISPAATHANIIKRIPLYLRERGFEELRRRFPQIDWDRAKVDAAIDFKLKTVVDDDAATTIATAYAELALGAERTLTSLPSPTGAERTLASPPSPTASPPVATIAPAPVHPADEYGAQIAGRPRERANPERWYAEQLQGYHQSQVEKDRARVFISMDQESANTLVSGMVSAARGQHEEHARLQAAKKASDGDDTPSLATRIKSWFD